MGVTNSQTEKEEEEMSCKDLDDDRDAIPEDDIICMVCQDEYDLQVHIPKVSTIDLLHAHCGNRMNHDSFTHRCSIAITLCVSPVSRW